MGIFSSNKFDVNDIKAIYEKANKDFNPSKYASNTKDPDPKTFSTKIYYKMLSVNYKALRKAMTGMNAKYYTQLEATDGDYSRRKGEIYEQVKARADWLGNLISSDKDLQYTMAGVFCDVFEALSNYKWKAAFKEAFAYCKKNKDDSKSILSAYKTLYFSMVLALETMLLKMPEFEYRLYVGVKSTTKAMTEVHYENKVFMNKVVIPAIKLLTLMKNTKEPLSLVKSTVKGEEISKQSKESAVSLPESQEWKSAEGFLGKAFAENQYLWAIFGSGFSAIAGLKAAGAGAVVTALKAGGVAAAAGAVTPVMAIIAVAFVLIFIFCIIPATRLIIYYAEVAKVDMQKELELNAELLSNNIAVLKQKYDEMNEGKEKDKLKSVIEKQNELYDKLKKRLGSYVDENEIEKDVDNDETEASKDAEAQSGNDGEDSDDSFELSI